MTNQPIKNKDIKELVYYLTLFRIKGHETWRAHLGGRKESFDDEQKRCWTNNTPEITDRQTLRIDRITGSFSS